MRVPPSQDAALVPHAGFRVADVSRFGLRSPLRETSRIAIMAHEAPAESIRAEVPLASMQHMAIEENHIAGLRADENLIVPVRDFAQAVLRIVHIAHAGDVRDIRDALAAKSGPFQRRID